MRGYTAMFLRSYRFEHIPGHEADPETDTYFAHVTGDNYKDAIQEGREQVFKADCREYGKTLMLGLEFGPDADTYQFMGLFYGHIEPVLHAWQEDA